MIGMPLVEAVPHMRELGVIDRLDRTYRAGETSRSPRVEAFVDAPDGGYQGLTRLEQGLAMADGYRDRVDVAILDIDLHGQDVFPLATILHDRGSPPSSGSVLRVAETREGVVMIRGVLAASPDFAGPFLGSPNRAIQRPAQRGRRRCGRR